MDVQNELNDLVQMLSNQLGTNLVGVYLHGSLAMGCYNPGSSDVDLLVVVKERLSTTSCRRIIDNLLQLEDKYLRLRTEMSVLLEKDLIEIKHPTPFSLHYSKEHKQKYLIDTSYICREDVDPDIAAHIMVVYHRGIVLYGKEVREVFHPIDKRYYVTSIMDDIKRADTDITIKPVYYTLNLCRVLLFFKQGRVSSKREGGEWAINLISREFKDIVISCLKIYEDSSTEIELDHDKLIKFAQYMLKEIKEEHTLMTKIIIRND